MSVSSAAEVMTLPVPQSNYRTFTQPVTDAPRLNKPSDALKQAAKAYKEELKAKKVDIITLANGDTCLLAFDKTGQLAMRNTRNKNVSGFFSSPWSTALSVVKVIGDNKNYYYDGTVFLDETQPAVNVIKTVDGDVIADRYSAISAFEIDGNVYFQCYDDKHSFFNIRAAYPAKSLDYQLSDSPFYYVPASDATFATDTVNAIPITLTTGPHKAYFGTSGGGRVYPDGSKGVKPNSANHYVTLMNTGYAVTAYQKPTVTVTRTTGIVDGEEKTGALLSIDPPATNTYINLNLYGPDGASILTSCKAIEFSEPEQMIYYEKQNNDGRTLMGAICLADTSLYLPAKFAYVRRAVNAEGNGVWLVSRKAFAPLEIYDPDADYTPVYRDKIEEYYNIGWYDDVLDRLMGQKDLSYENLLLLLSAYTIYVNDRMPGIEKIIAQYREGVEPEGMNDSKSPNRSSLDMFRAAYPFPELDGYCKQIVEKAPVQDKDIAKALAADAQATYKQADFLINEDLNNARREYGTIMAQRTINRIEAEAMAAQRAQEAAIREAQLRAERQQAIALTFINGLGNILQSTMSGSSGTSGRGASVSTGRGAAAMPSGTTSAATGKVDNSSRKAFLKSQIIEWKNKARKAEASYQQALSSGDDSWQKKNAIDSKRRSVDEALEMVRQYEAELNSLK